MGPTDTFVIYLPESVLIICCLPSIDELLDILDLLVITPLLLLFDMKALGRRWGLVRI